MGHFLSESSNLVVAQAALDILGEMALTEIGCGCIAVAASISDTDSWWREHGPTWFTVISGCLFGLFGPGVYTDIVKEEHLESEILRRQEMNDALNYYINKYGECAKVFWLERKPPRNISMDEIPSDVRSEFYQMLDSALLVDRMWNELGWPSYVYELPGGYEIWVYREGTEYYLKTDLIGNVLLSSVSYPKFSTGHLPKKSEFEGELAKLKKPSFLFPYQVGYLLMTCAIVGLTYIALQEVNDWKRSGGE